MFKSVGEKSHNVVGRMDGRHREWDDRRRYYSFRRRF